MFRHVSSRFGVPLRAALKRFKLAGAHPDLIASVHPNRAAENGQALIELERLLAERQAGSAPLASSRAESHTLNFWLKTNAINSRHDDGRGIGLPSNSNDGVGNNNNSVTALRKVTCTLTPFAADSAVRAQLANLFRDAGVDVDFELPPAIPDTGDLTSIIGHVHAQHAEHMASLSVAFQRGKRAAAALRELGVVVALEDRNATYLITMPEPTQNGTLRDVKRFALTPDRGALDAEQRRFLSDRCLEPFDFRMASSATAVERVVGALETLHGMYLKYQGTCLRPGVFYLLSVAHERNEITADGCIRLVLSSAPSWHDFLMSVPQPLWDAAMRQQKEWRSHQPTRLRERRTQLHRIADMLHIHTVRAVTPPGICEDAWIRDALTAFISEETAVRKTVLRYPEISHEILRRRGALTILPSSDSTGAEAQPRCRASADGRFYVTADALRHPPTVLKFLRAHAAAAAKAIVAYDDAAATLEAAAFHLGVNVTVDRRWREADAEAPARIRHFAKTLRDDRDVLVAALRRRPGLMIVVGERLEFTASGVVTVPWGASGHSLSASMLQR
jgi:hypothetical protein